MTPRTRLEGATSWGAARRRALGAFLLAFLGCGGGGSGPGSRDSGPDAASATSDGAVDAMGPASDASGTVDAGAEAAALTVPFYLGADITFTQQDEASGLSYSENGVTEPILQILKNHGFNYIRLRTFVDPTQPAPNPSGGGNFAPYSTQGFGDLAHTITFGQQIKAAGMGFLLDFHYSDYWADPGKQIKPAAWANDDLAHATTDLHDYTYSAIQALVAAGARPDMVQTGNEITPGILLTPGTGLGPRSPSGWPALAQLLNAGIQAIHEVDPTIKIMLHIDKGGDPAGATDPSEALANSIDFVDNAVANGVKFDVLGESCYVTYQGPPAGWQNTFSSLAARYPNLQFIMAEYNADPADPTDNELRQANDVIFNLPNHQGLGTFIWEPTRSSPNPGIFALSDAGFSYSPIPQCIIQYDQMKVDYGL